MSVHQYKPGEYQELLRQKKLELAGTPAQQTTDQRTSVEYTLYEDKRATGLTNYMNTQEVMKREPVRISAGLCPSCDRPIDSFTGECGCS